jgi:ATP-dependent RNA helicase MSS116
VRASDSDAPVMNAAFLSDVAWNTITHKVSPPTSRAISEVFRFERMSKVQADTLPVVMEGKDVFAKAKTGSGKTIAFALPIVELLVSKARHASLGGIRSVVISPTRELAMQILAEIKQLITFHTHLRAEAVIGGTKIEKERRLLMRGNAVHCDILVATPGRLVDHIESTPGFGQALASSNVLVLDEADRLLDMGFQPQLNRILAVLPPNSAGGVGRQNLLFSATMPPEVLSIATRVLRHGYTVVDCVGAEEPTHTHVRQETLVVPHASVLPALGRVLSHALAKDPAGKIIVFFPTARMTGFAASLFGRDYPGISLGLNIVEIHSRKSQSAREKASDRFRKERGVILLSSDVSARGMDYPDVSLVVQVGLTDREQYVHRLGRTARAGREGAGLLLLADFEARAMYQDLRDMPLIPAPHDSAITGGRANAMPGYDARDATPGAKGGIQLPVSPPVASLPGLDRCLAALTRNAELNKEATQAYVAWLGFYNTHLRRLNWTKEKLVAEGNAFFLGLGLGEVPLMPRDTLGKMGLRGVAGIREGPKGWKPNHQ